jgi:hypothetical protein
MANTDRERWNLLFERAIPGNEMSSDAIRKLPMGSLIYFGGEGRVVSLFRITSCSRGGVVYAVKIYKTRDDSISERPIVRSRNHWTENR